MSRLARSLALPAVISPPPRCGRQSCLPWSGDSPNRKRPPLRPRLPARHPGRHSLRHPELVETAWPCSVPPDPPPHVGGYGSGIARCRMGPRHFHETSELEAWLRSSEPWRRRLVTVYYRARLMANSAQSWSNVLPAYCLNSDSRYFPSRMSAFTFLTKSRARACSIQFKKTAVVW
jgi:hypothetical protein